MKKILIIGAICLVCFNPVFSQSKKAWEKAQSLNSISAYQDYLSKYPDGKFTELAIQQITRLQEEEVKKKEEESRRKMINDSTISKVDRMYYQNGQTYSLVELKPILTNNPASAAL